MTISLSVSSITQKCPSLNVVEGKSWNSGRIQKEEGCSTDVLQLAPSVRCHSPSPEPLLMSPCPGQSCRHLSLELPRRWGWCPKCTGHKRQVSQRHQDEPLKVIYSVKFIYLLISVKWWMNSPLYHVWEPPAGTCLWMTCPAGGRSLSGKQSETFIVKTLEIYTWKDWLKITYNHVFLQSKQSVVSCNTVMVGAWGREYKEKSFFHWLHQQSS